MDILAELFDILRLRSTMLFRAQLRGAWGFSAGGRPECAPCYIVTSGSCQIELAGDDQVQRLRAGDLVLLPHGGAHVVRAEPGAALVPLTELLDRADAAHPTREVVFGDGEALTVLVAGAFYLEPRAARLLFSDAIVVGPVQGETERATAGAAIELLTALICGEVTAERPGVEVAVSRLMDLLLVYMVRARITAEARPAAGEKGCFLRALADPLLVQALELIHQQPTQPWTVASLASRVGMSRTAFATRFAERAGVPPLMYIRQWRLLRASDLLRQGELPLVKIAEQAGYESGAAFTKAFKREMGVTPSAYRQQLQR